MQLAQVRGAARVPAKGALLGVAIAQNVLEACGVEIDQLRTELELFVDQNTPLLLGDEELGRLKLPFVKY